MRSKYLLAALALVAACQKPETAEQASARMQAEADSVRAQLQENAAAYARYMMGNHIDSLMTFYADNATMMPPNMAPVTGTAGIRQAFTGMMSQGAPTNVVFTVQSVVANGPLAFERGRYSMMMGPVADSGSYVNHWHLVNGQWKTMDEMWVSDNPPPPPAPAPRR